MNSVNYKQTDRAAAIAVLLMVAFLALVWYLHSSGEKEEEVADPTVVQKETADWELRSEAWWLETRVKNCLTGAKFASPEAYIQANKLCVESGVAQMKARRVARGAAAE